MIHKLRQLALLALAAWLILPAGWCCVPSVKVADDDSTVVKTSSCCQRHGEPSVPDRDPSESGDCCECCDMSFTASDRRSTVPQAAALFFPPGRSVWLPVESILSTDLPLSLPAAGKVPLHVLKCVWRC